jgi:integrase/recombinase XerD
MQLAVWLEPRCKVLAQATFADLQSYLAHLYLQETTAATSSRRLSSFKRFYQFLVREGLAQADPTSTSKHLKLPRGLPKSLTEADVNPCWKPDCNTPLGLRDKAMLETLCQWSARHELVTPKTVQVARYGCDKGNGERAARSAWSRWEMKQ